MLNLDTHIVVAAFSGQLRPQENRLLEDDPAWGVSAIVLWELFSLSRLGRLAIDVDEPQFNRDLARLRVWPISMHVCRQLRKLDFRSDPADELIAATSLAHDVPLLTRDTRLLASRVVPLATG